MSELLLHPEAAREWCRRWRAAGETIGFTPTMGALHDGHLELVRRSVRENARSVVSVFVNPLQFDEAADFERYPRDLAADVLRVGGVGCDLVLTGTLEEFFPGCGGDLAAVPREDPGPCAEGLEGEHRAGHFAGVATIVRRLFELVRPTVAYFGEKDFQQTLVVRDLARRLGFPEVRVCPTAREASGLARSSRNERLSPDERAVAAAISGALFATRDAFRAGTRDAGALHGVLRGALAGRRLRVEYAELRDPERWSAGALSGRVPRAQALVAARVGEVRLIDNLRLDGDGER